MDNETEVLVRLPVEAEALVLDEKHDVDKSASSSGTGTSIECKRSDSLEKHISQVVATCVMAKFTLKSTYPVLAVPAIMISLKKFLVVIYDCDSDILFATDMILLVDKNDILILSFVYFLHIVVNHKYLNALSTKACQQLFMHCLLFIWFQTVTNRLQTKNFPSSQITITSNTAGL